MLIFIFIIVVFIVCSTLSVAITVQRYSFSIFYPSIGLSVFIPLFSLTGVLLFSPVMEISWIPLLFRLFFASYICVVFFTFEFVKNFLQKDGSTHVHYLSNNKFPVVAATRVIALATVCASFFIPAVILPTPDNMVIYKCGVPCIVILFVNTGLTLFGIFLLENIFRFSASYQRKIARLCFVGLTAVLVSQLFFSGYLLLYRHISLASVQTVVAIFGLCFPVVLVGLFRYRLSGEQVTIPRNAVYSTFSLFLTGATFLGIGITAYVFRIFSLDLAYFDKALIVISLCLFAVLIIGSGTMRKRIALFINTNFYTHKYDYREQFNNLYRSFTTGENVSGTLTDIIENMKYSLGADDAYIFIANDADGNFRMHENKERFTDTTTLIGRDDLLVRMLTQSPAPVEKKSVSKPSAKGEIAPKILADIFFPVKFRGSLLGILAIKLAKNTVLGTEDKALIEVFANALGDVLFKSKSLEESVEKKQFESFSHLSSFIIHDIKNQAATLSLVVKNARTNIANPEFQKSLLTSLQSCSDNLQSLIEKLKSPPKTDALELNPTDISEVIRNVLENTQASAIKDTVFSKNLAASLFANVNKEALFYALKNIIVNALEATNYHGTISLVANTVSAMPPGTRERFLSSLDIFQKKSVFILISDNGCGMTRQFIEQRLFHPFATTKDKGVGIGLYQCKTLIEKMNGKILCKSEPGNGAEFCIIF